MTVFGQILYLLRFLAHKNAKSLTMLEMLTWSNSVEINLKKLSSNESSGINKLADADLISIIHERDLCVFIFMLSSLNYVPEIICVS